MHEYSIVQALLDACEENVKANSASKVTKVVIKIGIMSGVEPELLQSAFETFKEETLCHEAELVMQIQPIVVRCHVCLRESVLEKREYHCPNCKSQALDIIDGEDMYLMQLELE
jgi:hydrogenase nickel incorporation protein HypA/HybF